MSAILPGPQCVECSLSPDIPIIYNQFYDNMITGPFIIIWIHFSPSMDK